jgi:hypothetical protein
MSSLVVKHEVRQVGLEVRDKAIAIRSGRNSCSNTRQICTTAATTPYHDPETHAFAQDMSVADRVIVNVSKTTLWDNQVRF